MIPVRIDKRKCGGRIANRSVLREVSRLNGRNESAFEKAVRRTLETIVAKTIHFAGTNLASKISVGTFKIHSPAKQFILPERIEPVATKRCWKCQNKSRLNRPVSSRSQPQK